MKHPRPASLAIVLTAGTVALGTLATPALAAETVTVCAEGCDYETIQAAIEKASDGDVIEVTEDLTVAGTTAIDKDVTVTGGPGVTITQTADAITFVITGDGATLSDLTITSDVAVPKEFVQIGADDVTLSGNTIYGPEQALPMSKWVGNRGFVTQHEIEGLTVTDNTFHTMRSGSYLNGNGTGEISENTLYNTKGDFLIANADFTFTDNRAGDPDQRSEWSFVVFEGTAKDRYESMADLSAANNRMSAWDQRGAPTDDVKFVAPLIANDCKDGGWKDLDPKFENQGQCIKFVNTGK